MPAIRSERLVPTRAGMRTQAVARDGAIVDDFVIQESERIINVGNAPSPAATAALNIASTIVDHLVARASDQADSPCSTGSYGMSVPAAAAGLSEFAEKHPPAGKV